MTPDSFKNKKITVMGLGLNGGGLASVRYFAAKGAQVTATDLRTPEILAPSMEKLRDLPVRYVLGEHRMEDFEQADMVIKNPAVPADSPYLRAAKQVETDLSVFLANCKNPVIAVTGSKGKSTVVSALYAILHHQGLNPALGGNITVSPLTFLDELTGEEPVILELSSWQLGDLKGKNLLSPRISVITNIMNDHQNMYRSFQDYIDDKKVIYRGQKAGDYAIFLNDRYGREFAGEFRGTALFYQIRESPEVCIWQDGLKGYFKNPGNHNQKESLLPDSLRIPGKHFRQNCLIAASAARLYGINPETIRDALENFPGVPHRMELVRTWKGIGFYNDTTATIPEAMAAGVDSFNAPVRLIAGGNDKELDYSGAVEAFRKAGTISLLKGTATDKIISLLAKEKIPYEGPFDNLKEAFDCAVGKADSGDAVLLSPGATSFGMFINEFDRGETFRRLVSALGE